MTQDNPVSAALLHKLTSPEECYRTKDDLWPGKPTRYMVTLAPDERDYLHTLLTTQQAVDVDPRDEAIRDMAEALEGLLEMPRSTNLVDMWHDEECNSCGAKTRVCAPVEQQPHKPDCAYIVAETTLTKHAAQIKRAEGRLK